MRHLSGPGAAARRRRVGGVRSAEVDLSSGRATVDVSDEVTEEELVKAVQGKVVLSWARDALAGPRREER